MPLYAAMNGLLANLPASESAAQRFLSTLPPNVQEQLICAIYLGREHIHSQTLRDDVDLSRGYTDHIDRGNYARIVYEKGSSLLTYFGSLQRCASNSSFDLNQL